MIYSVEHLVSCNVFFFLVACNSCQTLFFFNRINKNSFNVNWCRNAPNYCKIHSAVFGDMKCLTLTPCVSAVFYDNTVFLSIKSSFDMFLAASQKPVQHLLWLAVLFLISANSWGNCLTVRLLNASLYLPYMYWLSVWCWMSSVE